MYYPAHAHNLISNCVIFVSQTLPLTYYSETLASSAKRLCHTTPCNPKLHPTLLSQTPHLSFLSHRIPPTPRLLVMALTHDSRSGVKTNMKPSTIKCQNHPCLPLPSRVFHANLSNQPDQRKKPAANSLSLISDEFCNFPITTLQILTLNESLLRIETDEYDGRLEIFFQRDIYSNALWTGLDWSQDQLLIQATLDC